MKFKLTDEKNRWIIKYLFVFCILVFFYFLIRDFSQKQQIIINEKIVLEETIQNDLLSLLKEKEFESFGNFIVYVKENYSNDYLKEVKNNLDFYKCIQGVEYEL